MDEQAEPTGVEGHANESTVVRQAQHLLMSAASIDAASALHRIVDESIATGRPVRDVAERIVRRTPQRSERH